MFVFCVTKSSEPPLCYLWKEFIFINSKFLPDPVYVFFSPTGSNMVISSFFNVHCKYHFMKDVSMPLLSCLN